MKKTLKITKKFSWLFYVTASCVVLSDAHAKVGVIDKLLTQIKENSIEVKISNLNAYSNKLLMDKEEFIFKPTVYMSSSYLNEESPQRSPFSTSNSTENEYKVGVKKLWSSGIQSEFSYGLSDVKSSFFNGVTNKFLQPKTELSLSTNLIQDIFYFRYKHLEKEVENGNEAIELNTRVTQKKLLTSALLSFSGLLEVLDEKKLQDKLCQKIEIQARKLSQKRKRGSISGREYYLSLRESSICQAKVENLQTQIIEHRQNFESKYSVSFKEFQVVKIDSLFKDLEGYYKSLSSAKSNNHLVNETDEMKYLEARLESSRSKQKKLNALSKSNLALELQTGLTGLNEDLGTANQDISDRSYPYVYLGVSLDLPLENREAKAEAIANEYKTKVIEEQKKLTLKVSGQRIKTLKDTLVNDFNIYQKYVNALKFSQKVLQEGQKDFSNGKLDFFSLTEFNKRLIEDQKILSSYRIQLIIRMVEYLDYYKYFDKYLEN